MICYTNYWIDEDRSNNDEAQPNENIIDPNRYNDVEDYIEEEVDVSYDKENHHRGEHSVKRHGGSSTGKVPRGGTRSAKQQKTGSTMAMKEEHKAESNPKDRKGHI